MPGTWSSGAAWIGVLMAGALLAIALPSPAAAQGRFYKYVDEDGVTHFTNVPRPDARYKRIKLSSEGFRNGPDFSQEPPVYHEYDSIILRAARAYRLQPALVKAVIAAESNFEPNAISRAGALGLMQLMPQTALSLGVREPFHPESNVLGGTRYLSEMLARYGDVTRALAAYNAGPTAVDRYAKIPPYKETQEYVSRVLDYYHRYTDDFSQ